MFVLRRGKPPCLPFRRSGPPKRGQTSVSAPTRSPACRSRQTAPFDHRRRIDLTHVDHLIARYVLVDRMSHHHVAGSETDRRNATSLQKNRVIDRREPL